MFGLSFGELVVLLLVSMVVLGPKELPQHLRKAGQLAGRLRRMAYDMRVRSGIDEVLRTEGIDRDLAELRRLTRGELATVVGAMRGATRGVRLDDVVPPPPPYPANEVPMALPAAVPSAAPAPPRLGPYDAVPIDREREYPRGGVDSYAALPESAFVYEGGLPASPLADDPLYTGGVSS